HEACNLANRKAREGTMAGEDKKPSGPDLSEGIPAADLGEGAMITGHVGEDDVMLARKGGKLFAVSAHCTHYHGPLAEGLLVGETIRCPWHHAHFNLQTGEAIAAPALAAVTCWSVEEKGVKIFVKDQKEEHAPGNNGATQRVVTVGGGA